MAQLIAIALETHPRIGSCFVIRFSWNSRLEDPVTRLKEIVPVAEREYDSAGRQWWVAAVQVESLAALFTNWAEEVAALARADPERLSAVMVEVLRERIVCTVDRVLDAVPTLSYEDLLAALGGTACCWLADWREATPAAAAAIPPARLAQVQETAAAVRQDLRAWSLRAAFLCALLDPGTSPLNDPDA